MKNKFSQNEAFVTMRKKSFQNHNKRTFEQNKKGPKSTNYFPNVHFLSPFFSDILYQSKHMPISS